MKMRIIEDNLITESKSLTNPNEFKSFANQQMFSTHQSQLKDP